jgi:dipeptidyl aminopeptidase/acylaminoacyl peptidase
LGWLALPFVFSSPHCMQTATAPVATAPSEEAAEHLRSRLFIYDLHDGSSHLVYTAASIWEAPNWSPDGTYLLSNSGGHIYRFTLGKSGTAEPQELVIPSKFECNNDKAISPDGKKLAFSATATGIAKEQAEQSDPQALQWVSLHVPCDSHFPSVARRMEERIDLSSAR